MEPNRVRLGRPRLQVQGATGGAMAPGCWLNASHQPHPALLPPCLPSCLPWSSQQQEDWLLARRSWWCGVSPGWGSAEAMAGAMARGRLVWAHGTRGAQVGQRDWQGSNPRTHSHSMLLCQQGAICCCCPPAPWCVVQSTVAAAMIRDEVCYLMPGLPGNGGRRHRWAQSLTAAAAWSRPAHDGRSPRDTVCCIRHHARPTAQADGAVCQLPPPATVHAATLTRNQASDRSGNTHGRVGCPFGIMRTGLRMARMPATTPTPSNPRSTA